MQGIARFETLDGVEVFSLTDGASTEPVDWFETLTVEEMATRLGGATLTVQFNAFLIRSRGHLTLVDTGYGAFAGDGGAQVPERLTDLGVTPDQIDTLFFTHLHTDHSGGALTDGAPTYPRAQVCLHPAEAAYWQDRDHNGARVLAAYADRLRLAQDGAEIAPGLTLWHLPGHTPGHSGLRVGADLALAGDIFHAAQLQFADPLLATKYDVDSAQATATRQAVLTEAAQTGIIIAGSHAVTPYNFARIRKSGAGFEGVSI